MTQLKRLLPKWKRWWRI